jgi:hypothetical protein
MKIQVNADKQVAAGAEFTNFAETELKRTLARFEPRLTRLEVHLSDLNSSQKGGLRDKRCMLEARPAGQKPVSVTHEAGTPKDALKGAAGKMRRLLQTSFGRITTRAVRGSSRTARKTLPSPTVNQLDKIDAALSEILASAEHAGLETHIRKASDAVKRARSLAAPAPAKKSAGKKSSPLGSRGPKKKKVYRARRKAWPKR